MKPLRLYIHLLLTLLPGCAAEDLPVYRVDNRLEKYVMHFFEEGERRGRKLDRTNLILSVTPDLLVNEGKTAVTRGTNNGQIVIEIDDALLSSNDTLFLEFALMHEFGHGFLKRGHCTTVSIMNPSRKIVDRYRRSAVERSHLFDELFQAAD